MEVIKQVEIVCNETITQSDGRKSMYSAAQEERQRKLQEYLTAKGKMKSSTKPYLKNMNTPKPKSETTVHSQSSKMSRMKENMPPNRQKGRCGDMSGKTIWQNASLQLSELNNKNQRTKNLTTAAHVGKPRSTTQAKPIRSKQTETKCNKDCEVYGKECALLQMVAKEEKQRPGKFAAAQKSAPTEILVCTSLPKTSDSASSEAAQQTGEREQSDSASLLTAHDTASRKPQSHPLKKSSAFGGMSLPVNRCGIGPLTRGPIKGNADRLGQSSKSSLTAVSRTSCRETRAAALAKQEHTYGHFTLNSARPFSGQPVLDSISMTAAMRNKTIPFGNRSVSTSNSEKINGGSFPHRQTTTGTATSVVKVSGARLPSRQQIVENANHTAKNSSKYCPSMKHVVGNKTNIIKSSSTFPSRPSTSSAIGSKREHTEKVHVKPHPSGNGTSIGRVNKSCIDATRRTTRVAKTVGNQQPVKTAQQIGKAAVFRGAPRDFKAQRQSLASTRVSVQPNCGSGRLETVVAQSQNTANKTLRFSRGLSNVNTQGGLGQITMQNFNTECKAAEYLNKAVGHTPISTAAATVLQEHPEGGSSAYSVEAQREHLPVENGKIVSVVGPATPAVQSTEVEGFLTEREKRRKKLEEWLSAKKKQYKRPAMILPTPKKTPKAKSNDLFWVNFEEGDEHCSLMENINQVLSQCLNLIQQGFPSEKLLGILSRIPYAEKFAQYWICKARLSERDGCFDTELFERAVNAGAQPIQDLKAVIIDILKNQSKTSTGEEEGLPVDVRKAPRKNLSTPNPNLPVTRSHAAQKGSSVIKFQVGVIPRVKESQLPTVSQDMKLLTPVRRSLRLEHASECHPDMLKEHDPVVTCLNELFALEEVSCYIYRKNEALPEEEEEEEVEEKEEDSSSRVE